MRSISSQFSSNWEDDDDEVILLSTTYVINDSDETPIKPELNEKSVSNTPCSFLSIDNDVDQQHGCSKYSVGLFLIT